MQPLAAVPSLNLSAEVQIQITSLHSLQEVAITLSNSAEARCGLVSILVQFFPVLGSREKIEQVLSSTSDSAKIEWRGPKTAVLICGSTPVHEKAGSQLGAAITDWAVKQGVEHLLETAGGCRASSIARCSGSTYSFSCRTAIMIPDPEGYITQRPLWSCYPSSREKEGSPGSASVVLEVVVGVSWAEILERVERYLSVLSVSCGSASLGRGARLTLPVDTDGQVNLVILLRIRASKETDYCIIELSQWQRDAENQPVETSSNRLYSDKESNAEIPSIHLPLDAFIPLLDIQRCPSLSQEQKSTLLSIPRPQLTIKPERLKRIVRAVLNELPVWREKVQKEERREGRELVRDCRRDVDGEL